MYHFVQYLYHFIFSLLCQTLVVPCLDNIFMVLLISALATIGVMKPIFLDSGSPRREGGGRVCVGMVCYHCIVLILNSSKNSIFFVSNSDLCRAMLPNYLRTYSSALCQIRALEKAFGSYVFDKTIFLKWGILNVPFCSIFVPFHFYLIMTLVVPRLDNIFMVLADLCTCKNWCDKTFFFLF